MHDARADELGVALVVRGHDNDALPFALADDGGDVLPGGSVEPVEGLVQQ